jgi:hypothetical protein
MDYMDSMDGMDRMDGGSLCHRRKAGGCNRLAPQSIPSIVSIPSILSIEK